MENRRTTFTFLSPSTYNDNNDQKDFSVFEVISKIMSTIVILTFLAVLALFLPYILRSALSFEGRRLKARAEGRRDAIVALTHKDIATPSPTPSAQNHTPEDSDWEHISTIEPAHSSPNGMSATPSSSNRPLVIGFFHPFCNAGGGGERVLWAAIRATQLSHPDAICVVYSGDHDIDRDIVVKSVKNRFGITLEKATLHFVYLTMRGWVLASTWPHFTLLGQSLGSVGLAWDAFNMLVPDVFIDTMGYAFAVAFSRYLFPEVSTGAYVHYPTISTDMLDSLDDTSGEKGLNSGAGVGLKGMLKRQYWHFFARLYGWMGSHIDVVICNSSWTRAHISKIWKLKSPPAVVYPPCPVEEFENKIEVSTEAETKRENLVLYIAQFRPEKNHSLILRAFAKYLHSVPEKEYPRLVLIGSVRNGTGDAQHVYNLRLEARELKIKTATTFLCDASFEQIQEYLQRATIGVNGMWNEHFGIGVVEYVAAGLIPVVHNSGGPRLDIVTPYNGRPTGYLAETDEEFAEGFRKVATMTVEEKVAMRLRGRESAKRFTEDAFAKLWVEKLDDLIRGHRAR